MFRQLIRSVRPMTRLAIATPRVNFQSQLPRLASSIKFYSTTQSTLTKEDVFARSIAVLRSFQKTSVDSPSSETSDITLETQFVKDLGMDSLDYNDVLVALEEEFDIIFDDETANSIKSLGECVDYIVANHLPAEEGLNSEIR